jgi:hypothetical protein
MCRVHPWMNWQQTVDTPGQRETKVALSDRLARIILGDDDPGYMGPVSW